MLRYAYIAVFQLLVAILPMSAEAKTWYKADSHNFVIYSDGSQDQTEKMANDLEKFDALMRMLFNIKPAESPNRLTVFLVDRGAKVASLADSGRGVAGFYSPRTAGSFAVSNRERGQEGRLDGQTTLFHEYTHHFMFRHFNVPIPAWFSEGFAEYAATAEFNKNGSWEFGRLAHHRAYSLQQGNKISIRDLLAKTPRSKGVDRYGFYAWSWALTHMLYQSEQRRKQFGPYLKALEGGKPPLEAAEIAFGDLDELEHNLRRYVRGMMNFSRSKVPIPYDSDIRITKLDDYQSELADLRMKRLTNYKPESTLDDLRVLTARPDANADGWYELAMQEYQIAHRKEGDQKMDFSRAKGAVDRALTLAPDHLYANILKGDLLLEPMDHDDNPDPGLWQQAQKYYARANRADPSHQLPLFRLSTLLMRQGRTVDNMEDALTQAFLQAPESRELRVALANFHANQGNTKTAIRLLEAIAGNPHNGRWARQKINELQKTGRVQGEREAALSGDADIDDDTSDGGEGDGDDEPAPASSAAEN